MELQKIGNYIIAHQRQGNNVNGNPMYIINVFKSIEDKNILHYYNVNYRQSKKLDKHGNIKITSYNTDDAIMQILNDIESCTIY